MGQYTGTGTYGDSNPTTLQFPFEPIILFMPVIPETQAYIPSIPFSTNLLTDSYKNFYLSSYNNNVGIKRSPDRKSILCKGSDAYGQFNFSDLIYYFAAIGGYDMGGQIEWTITSSGTWTVPKTGTYYIELYGFGGAGQSGQPYASGGASCQSYDSVVLTKGQVIDVSIASYNGTTTSFGSYTVAGGGAPSNQAPYYGAGSGNKGKNGAYSFGSHTDVTIGNGVLSARYGVGQSSRDPYGTTGRDGAVYLKYLGA